MVIPSFPDEQCQLADNGSRSPKWLEKLPTCFTNFSQYARNTSSNSLNERYRDASSRSTSPADAPKVLKNRIVLVLELARRPSAGSLTAFLDHVIIKSTLPRGGS